MPYILDRNGKYVYQFDAGQYEGEFDANQLDSLDKLKNAFVSVNKFNDFMEAEAVKPITFTHDKEDGSTEEVELKDPEAAKKMLRDYKRPFIEAGRPGNIGAHLMAFALKNHITLSELELLAEKPQDPRCAEIQGKLDTARKDFYRTSCCENISIQKVSAVSFYLGHIDAYKNELEKIINSPAPISEKMAEFSKLSLAFQSVGVQTLGSSKKKGSPDQVYGQDIIRMVNDRLNTLNTGYTFENIYNLGGLGDHLAQNLNELSSLPHTGSRLSEDELAEAARNNKSEEAKVVNATRVSRAFNGIYEAFSNAGNSVVNALTFHTDEQSGRIHSSIKNVTPPDYNNPGNPDEIEFLHSDEDARIDMRLNMQEGVYPKPVPPANFKAAMGGLLYGAGSSIVSAKKQKLPEDREFRELTEAMLASRKIMSDPGATRDEKVTAMRQVQLRADDYIAKNSGNTAEMAQERVEQAKMAFSVAAGERKVLEGLASPDRSKVYEQQPQPIDINARLPFMKNMVANLNKEIEAVDPLYVRSSQAFKDTKKALKELNKACAALDKAPSREKLEQLRKAFKSVSENAEIYVRQKSSEANPSALAKKRLDFMKDLSASIDDSYCLMSKAAGKKIITNETAAEQLKTYSDNLLNQARGQAENKDVIAQAVALRKVSERIAGSPDALFNSTAVDKAVAAMTKDPTVREETASIINQASPARKAKAAGPQR